MGRVGAPLLDGGASSKMRRRHHAAPTAMPAADRSEDFPKKSAPVRSSFLADDAENVGHARRGIEFDVVA